ncbi:MAG TPA: GtrA family protein, partial [Nitrososphaerales archaeon]|nr:GtrA family protein [Nitrososphaerales archaeon]
MTDGSKAPFFSLAHFQHFIKFAVVGTIGIVVNEGLLILIKSRGVYFLTAGAVAIEISILSNFVLNDLWTFRDRRTGRAAARLVKFNALML